MPASPPPDPPDLPELPDLPGAPEQALRRAERVKALAREIGFDAVGLDEM